MLLLYLTATKLQFSSETKAYRWSFSRVCHEESPHISLRTDAACDIHRAVPSIRYNASQIL